MPDPLVSALAPQAVLASDLLQAHPARLLAPHAAPLAGRARPASG
jgi:hypothetical protein